MFIITSIHALKWPSVKAFKLAKGENSFASADAVPEAVRSKLARFAERGVVKFSTPPAWAPKAEVKEVGDDGAASPTGSTNPSGTKTDGFDVADVELNEKALSKLTVDQLKLVAAEYDVDVSSAKNKAETIAAILKEVGDDSSTS
jgi:hypothetical protein